MKPGLGALIGLRREWRHFHRNQDYTGAGLAFHKAGISETIKPDFSSLPALLREKLSEFGREWEGALAVNAASEGYSFYRADLALAVNSVQPFSDWTEKKLEDTSPVLGTSLFFESNGMHPLHDGVWSSFFYFTLHSGTSPESLKFNEAPGVRNQPTFMRIS